MLATFRSITFGFVLIIINLQSFVGAQGEAATETLNDKNQLKQLLIVAKEELQSRKLSDKEVQLRLKIVEDVATVKAYFPHVLSGPPEYRNPKFWKQNDDGYYVPRDKASDAIRDLWKTKSGIRCHKLSTLVMLKGLIDVSSEKQLARLDTKLAGKVIPSDLPDEGVGDLFEEPEPKDGGVFHEGEFLPGDEVWFDNPYFDRLESEQQSDYRGQEGHHVFYIGGGKLMDMYSREPISIEDFRHTFLRWASVRIVAKRDDVEPKADEFQIKQVRRVRLKASHED